MTTAAGSPEKQGYIFVTFRHGSPASPTYERYARTNIDTDGFAAKPNMGVDIPDNTGTFDNKEARILLDIDDFTSPLSSGLPHSPIFVQIEEVTQGLFTGDAGTRKTLFKGRVTRTIRNYQGRNDTVAFFALPIKARLDVPMGLQANHHCGWRLFSMGCGRLQALHQVFGQIAAIDGKEITISANPAITSPSSPGGNVDRFWERGFLLRDGLTIGVHLWVLTTPTVFVLRRRPPDSWLLAGPTSITFVPGCHKTIEDCRDVWDNEEGYLGQGGFGGFGYAMPPYNPLFENPQ